MPPYVIWKMKNESKHDTLLQMVPTHSKKQLLRVVLHGEHLLHVWYMTVKGSLYCFEHPMCL